MEEVARDGAPLEAARGAVLAFPEEVLAARHEEGDAAEHDPEPRHVPEERRVPGKTFVQLVSPADARRNLTGPTAPSPSRNWCPPSR